MGDTEKMTERAVEGESAVDEILESVPEEQRKVIKKEMVSLFQMGGMINPENAISEKITEQHITQYLEGAREDMQSSYTEKRQSKIFIFLSMLAAMIFFLAVIIILKDNPDIMEKVIYTLGGLIAGAFGGYGIGKKKSDQ